MEGPAAGPGIIENSPAKGELRLWTDDGAALKKQERGAVVGHMEGVWAVRRRAGFSTLILGSSFSSGVPSA